MRAHGSKACYVFGPEPGGDSRKGCRCPECCASNAIYERDRARRLEPAYVIADPAREHVAWLSAQGVGLKQVAKTSGVSQGSLWKLVYGKKRPDGRQEPSRRIRKSTLDAILAVQPSHGAQGSRVPAGPVWEMIDRLVTAGVPKARIAERCGQRGPGLQLGRQVVTRENARAIKTMVAEMDAGTLVTVKRHRNGGRVIAPPAADPVPVDHYNDGVRFIATMADLLEECNAQGWRHQAACRNRPPWLFFPARGDDETLMRAKRICSACFVRAECLAANIDQRDGIYGGLSAKARRRLREAA